jgi:hypothetical protein
MTAQTAQFRLTGTWEFRLCSYSHDMTGADPMSAQPSKPSLVANLAEQLASPVAAMPTAPSVTVHVPPGTTVTLVVSTARAEPEAA